MPAYISIADNDDAGECPFAQARQRFGTPLPANRTKWSPAIMTPEFVRATLELRDGAVFWRHREDFYFFSEQTRSAWNERFAGWEIKSRINSAGYRIASICQAVVGFHRLVWLLAHGDWPRFAIDHIDGDPLNNDIANLRDVPLHINSRNQKPSGKNTSGRIGVNWEPKRRKWRACGKVDGRSVTLARCDTFAAACAVRAEFEAKHGFTPRHLNIQISEYRSRVSKIPTLGSGIEGHPADTVTSGGGVNRFHSSLRMGGNAETFNDAGDGLPDGNRLAAPLAESSFHAAENARD